MLIFFNLVDFFYNKIGLDKYYDKVIYKSFDIISKTWIIKYICC